MSRGEKREAAEAAAAEILAGVASVVVEPPAGGPSAALIGSLFDTLVIYDEVSVGDAQADWPLAAAGGRGGTTATDWLAPPPKRPRQLVLPGMQTAIAAGLTEPPARPGEDVFLPAMDLIAAGGHTLLVTRWRSGGQLGASLIREYLRETAGPSGLPPAAAWQRAVDVVVSERPDPDREPRVKQASTAVLENARHPLFWAGYLLVDCGWSGAAADPPAPPPPPVARPAPAAPPAAGGPLPPAILPPPPPRPGP